MRSKIVQELRKRSSCLMYQPEFRELLAHAADTIEILADENGGWIPADLCLPECEYGAEVGPILFQIKDTDTIESGYYGVGGKHRDIYFRTYRGIEDYDVRDVIAWRAMPIPYEARK